MKRIRSLINAHKRAILLVIGIVLIGYTGLSIFQTVTKKAVLSLLIVNPVSMETSVLEDELRTYLKEDNPKHYIRINTVYLPEGTDYKTTPSINAMIASQTVDLVIAPKKVHEPIENTGLYEKIEAIYTGELEGNLVSETPYRASVLETRLKDQYGLVAEENAHLSVLHTTENKDTVNEFLRFIYGYPPWVT